MAKFDDMPVNCPCFQEILSDALDRSGMGVGELARRLGSRSAVQATGWLHGARLPDDRMIAALSNDLDIDAFYLCLVCWMDEKPAYRSDLALTMQQRGWPIPKAARTALRKPEQPKQKKKKKKKKKPNKISDKPGCT
ncbi:MAG: helix-turn-helix transcriptional regulator [Brevundimonas sp.]|nr:helix-turn-helix transcriptional regulator [Brevundimonas sp.]